jgi:hypothetical protein
MTLSGAGQACSISEPYYTNCKLVKDEVVSALMLEHHQSLGMYLVKVEGTASGAFIEIGGPRWEGWPEDTGLFAYHSVVHDICMSDPLGLKDFTFLVFSPYGLVRRGCSGGVEVL